MKNEKELDLVVGALSPTDYFNKLKDKKHKITESELEDFYNGCLSLVEKYKYTKQYKLIEKLHFLVQCVEKEKKLVQRNIDSFVYREDIEDYIDNVSKNVVKIIELENYPRDIPDNIVDIIKSVDGIFDKKYVVFTDYTGKIEKQVEKERREKDPILFGTFQQRSTNRNNTANLINDRFYFLGDWEDEFCDLTMDKFLKEAGREKLQKISQPLNEKEIIEDLNRMNEEFKFIQAPQKQIQPQEKKSFFQKLFKK